MPTPLLSSTSPDFVDLRFDVELLAPTRPDTCRARLSAHHDGHDVGFLLEVATDLEPGLLAGGEVARSAFRRDAVRFVSEGARTDRFVEGLARVTGVVPPGLPTRESLQFTAFPLQEGAVQPFRGPCRLKLFHDDPLGRGDYAEVFLDLASGGVAIEEKDSDYRPYWVRAWSVSPVPWSRVTLLLDPGPTLAQVEPDDIRRALEALGQTARRAVLADGDGASLFFSRTTRGVACLASQAPVDGEARWAVALLAPDDAERVALAWAADGTLLGQGWQGVAWEQVSGVFGPTP